MLPHLSRNVKILSLVSFAQDAASDMLYPILPLFITTVLGAPPIALGAIEGVAEATAAGMKAVSGRLADTRRKKPLIFGGYLLSALAKPLIGLAGGWPHVLVARFLDRAGKGIRTTPRDALIAEETDSTTRGAAFGFHRAADSAGAVIGPLLGLIAYNALDGQIRLLFVVAFIPAILSAAMVLAVRERPSPVVRKDREETKDRGSQPLPRAYWRVVILLGAFGLVNFADVFLLLRAERLGLNFSSVILVYVLYNVVYSALSYPAGRLSDRIGRNKVFALGLVVFSVCYIGLGLAREASAVWVLIPLYGAYTALTDGVGKAWVSDLVPKGSSGTGLGYFHAITGGTALVAGLWAGAAWGASGVVPLLISGVGAAVMAIAVMLLRPPQEVSL